MLLSDFDASGEHGAKQPQKLLGFGLVVSGLLRRLEAVSHTMHGVEPLGVLGVVSQLGAKILHMGIDGALIALEIVAGARGW